MFAKNIKSIKLFSLSLSISLFFASHVHALPWDVDMYKQQSYKPGELARAPVEGTVPVGFKPFTMTIDEAEAQLENPVLFSKDSVIRGKRLYSSNCTPCHGPSGNAEGPVGPLMAVPSLLTDFYKQKKDGRIYGVIKIGGSNMPRYGFKFSEREHWDLVNYIRFLQGRDVAGLTRPVAAKK